MSGTSSSTPCKTTAGKTGRNRRTGGRRGLRCRADLRHPGLVALRGLFPAAAVKALTTVWKVRSLTSCFTDDACMAVPTTYRPSDLEPRSGTGRIAPANADCHVPAPVWSIRRPQTRRADQHVVGQLLRRLPPVVFCRFHRHRTLRRHPPQSSVRERHHRGHLGELTPEGSGASG